MRANLSCQFDGIWNNLKNSPLVESAEEFLKGVRKERTPRPQRLQEGSSPGVARIPEGNTLLLLPSHLQFFMVGIYSVASILPQHQTQLPQSSNMDGRPAATKQDSRPSTPETAQTSSLMG